MVTLETMEVSVMPLYVNGSSSFQDQVRGALEHLDPSIEIYDGRVGFDPTMSPGSHTRGHELLRRLIQSGYRVEIVQGSSSRCEPAYPRGGRTGSRVYWCPGQVPSNAPACFCIALGHELGHADQFLNGIVYPADLYSSGSSSVGFSMRVEMLNITGRHMSETWAGVTENQLRQEHRPPCPARTIY